MEAAASTPDTINKLRFAADGAFAMLAGMQLDVFTPLADGPKTADQIGEAIGVRPDRLRLLLYALAAARLLDTKDGFFENTPEAARFLVRGNPDYLFGMDSSWANQWRAKLGTAESIRTGVPQAKLDFSKSAPEKLEEFLRMLNGQAAPTARELTTLHDFSSIKTLVDVGGGAAGLSIALTQACPQIRATVVELPLVASIARKVVDEEGVGNRVRVMTADVVHDPLPGSYDAAVLRNLLQVLSPEDAQKVLMNTSGAMNAGGTLYIVGHILDNARTSPPDAVGFNLLFINQFDEGECYTEEEHRAWLMKAGFVNINRANALLTGGRGVITARKPN